MSLAISSGFWDWVYAHICEVAARKGEAALWVPTEPCIICQAPMLPGKRFCGDCGAYQLAHHLDTDTLPAFAVLINGQEYDLRLDGRHPFQAYADKLREIQSEQ